MISIICPVYNEEKHIGKLLDFFTTSTPADKEMIVVDGGSTDDTVLIVTKWQKQFPSIHLIHNPKKYVPFALNKAIAVASGEIIIRVDAHTQYAADYIEKILAAFHKSGASIVGGPMRAIGHTPFQKAVSYTTSTVFGIGNSQFHFETYEGYTDSVYLGAWKNEVFDRLGGFDEEMLRNQDDEFHYRAAQSGIKIYQDPAIRSTYLPRSSYKTLCKQYFEYGLFKPLVLKKVSAGFQIRHCIPASFVLYISLLPLSIFFSWLWIPLLVYLATDFFFTLKSKLSFAVMMHVCIVYPALHLSYGLGFIKGLKKTL